MKSHFPDQHSICRPVIPTSSKTSSSSPANNSHPILWSSMTLTSLSFSPSFPFSGGKEEEGIPKEKYIRLFIRECIFNRKSHWQLIVWWDYYILLSFSLFLSRLTIEWRGRRKLARLWARIRETMRVFEANNCLMSHIR